jgi:hypothetical protein
MAGPGRNPSPRALRALKLDHEVRPGRRNGKAPRKTPMRRRPLRRVAELSGDLRGHEQGLRGLASMAGPCFAKRVHDNPEKVVALPFRMAAKVTNNDTEGLPCRTILRNADRILSILGASRCQKSDPRNGSKAKALYHGLLGGRSRLGGRKLLRNNSISGFAMLKHLGAGGASTLRLSHYRA